MATAEWSEKTRLIITIGVVGVVNLGTWYGVYRARSAWQAKVGQLKKLDQDVERLQARANQRRDLATRKKKLENENEQRMKELPDATERNRFIADISDLERKTKLVFKSRTPQYDQRVDVRGVPPENFTRDFWRSSYAADFKGLCEFLNTLEEHNPRYISIENLNITAAASGMGVTGAKHQVRFNVVTYRYVRKPEGIAP